MTEFTVPELGENVEGGDVTRVLVKVGDTVARDQPVIELETDKATIEVPSSVAGVVREIKVKPGDRVKVGAPLLALDDSTDGNGGSAAASSAPSRPQPGPGPAAEKVASEGSSKPAPRPSARQAAQKAEAPRPDAVEAETQTREAQKPETQKVVSMARPPRPVEPPARDRGPAAPASPAVRRLAREVGVDIDDVQGTGPGGRISLEDVKEHARRILSSVGPTAADAARGLRQSAVRPLPDFSKWGEIERQPMSNIRRRTAEHLSQAWNAIPHVTQCEKADITALEELRRRFSPQIEAQAGKLTITAILVKVLAVALRQFPQFNASVDFAAEEIVLKKYVHIGVAVDTDRGLLVPVIRDADRKNISRIAVEVQDAAARARDRKLTLEEMSGGSMSISNLGGIGGTYFTPIVNWPEVAILGVSRGHLEPVWRDGAFQPRLLLPLSLSYDHRVIDGADAMRFLRWVADALEQPFLLALHG